jgi:hypothetical protein
MPADSRTSREAPFKIRQLELRERGRTAGHDARLSFLAAESDGHTIAVVPENPPLVRRGLALPWLIATILHRLVAIGLIYGPFLGGKGGALGAYWVLDLPVIVLLDIGTGAPSSEAGTTVFPSFHPPMHWLAVIWSVLFGFLCALIVRFIRERFPTRPETPQPPGNYDY